MESSRTSPVRRHVGGFTLVEMLTVLLILAIILGLVVGISKKLMEEAARKQTEATQSVLMDAVMRYKQINGSTPGGLGDLLSGPEAVKQIVGTLSSEVFTSAAAAKDGWGADMVYQPAGGAGGTPVIISGGPDRNTGTADDNIRSDNH